jgi:DNA-binding response OmpR family regulator
MAKILIVEDDPHISRLVQASLQLAGHEAICCMRGDDAMGLINREEYDLILLDVMLPGMDGFEMMEHLQGLSTPVIFLTAREDVTDRVRGLRLGAEDYIIKPFEPVELLARVDVVLRRVGRDKTQLRYEDIVLSLDERVARKGGRKVQLTPKEFDLLALLIRSVDIALSRDKILSVVWGYTYEGETRTVDIHIQQLRKKLDLKDRIRTVNRIGYRLESQE